MHRLRISMQDTLIGILSVDENEIYHFTYDTEWEQGGFAISPHLGFFDNYSSPTIKKFLENLIPEGEGLEEIASFIHIAKSNTYAILHTIGYETAGALVFGAYPEQKYPLFREISPEELTERIAQIESRSIAIWDKKVLLSLAGVQAKLPVILRGDTIGLGDGMLSSTHIMKFQTKKYLHIVVNELYCMTLAKRIGLNVAEVALRRFGAYPVLLVERFDRIVREDLVERLHIIDGCQMLDLPASYKYEQNFGSGRDVAQIREGASFKKLFAMSKVCNVPAKAKLELIHWAMFTLIIGNSDAHGKNISFFVNKQGIHPAPLYDMLCVMMYDFDHGFAMAYGEEFDPNKVQAYELRVFAEEAGVHYKLIAKILTTLCDNIVRVLAEGVLENTVLTKDELAFVDKLEKLIGERAMRFKKVAEEMPLVSY